MGMTTAEKKEYEFNLKRTILEGLLVGCLTIDELREYVKENLSIDYLEENSLKQDLMKHLSALSREKVINKVDIKMGDKVLSYYFIIPQTYAKIHQEYKVRSIKELVNYKITENHNEVVDRVCNMLKNYFDEVIREYPVEYKYRDSTYKGRIDIAVLKNGEPLFGIEYEQGGNPPMQIIRNFVKCVNHFKRPTIFLVPPQLFGYYKMLATYFFYGQDKFDVNTETPIYLVNAKDFESLTQLPPENLIYEKFPYDADDMVLLFENVKKEDVENEDDVKEMAQQISEAESTEQNSETASTASVEVSYNNGQLIAVQKEVITIPSLEKQYSDILERIELLIKQWKEGKEQDVTILAQIISMLKSMETELKNQSDTHITQTNILTNLDIKMNKSLHLQEVIQNKVTHTHAIISNIDLNLENKYKTIIILLSSILVAYTGALLFYYFYILR